MGKVNLEEQIANHVIKFKENYYRLAYSYVKNEQDALDIIQESIYKAFSSTESLKNPDFIKTWFYRIVVNTSIDFLRKKKKVVLVDEEFISNHDVTAVDKYEDLDLKKALESLPIDQRNVITLRYFEDLKLEEIAEILSENLNTVKTRLYSGLKRLRIMISDESLKEVKLND